MNYNRITLIGRMVADPELKVTPSGISVTQFRLAVNRPISSEAKQRGEQEQADFIDISTWRQNAEYVANYLNKGRLVLVEGKLQIREYVDKEGQKRKAAEVVADLVKGLDRREQDGDNAGGASGGQYAQGGGGYSGNQSQGGTRGEYDQTPREAAPARPAGGGYGGGQPAPQRPAQNRNAPPAGNNYSDGADGFDDPFADN